jgi:hypothetical protein
MALDPSIPLSVQQPKLQLPDPVEQYSKALTIKTLLGQQDLQGIQLQTAQQGLSDDAATRAAYQQSGGDLGTLRALLSKGGQYKEVQAIDKLMLDNSFKQSEIAKNTADVPKIQQEALSKADTLYRDAFGTVANPQEAAQLITAGFNHPLLGPKLQMNGSLQDHLQRIPQDAAKFDEWKQLMSPEYAKSKQAAATLAETARGHTLTAQTAKAGQDVTLRGQNLVDARTRERLAYDQAQPKGQVVPTEQGLMLADPRAATAQPMLGPDGQPLERPLKAIPPSANTGILENANNLRRAEQALALVEGKTVNTAKGSTTATGFKGYLPGAILNRTDPTGVETRAAIADLGSLIIHERSGAAVTASESPRLVPFIPQVTDDHATVVKKLRRFTEIYRDMAKNLDETYSKDQGYRPNPVSARGAGAGIDPASLSDAELMRELAKSRAK